MNEFKPKLLSGVLWRLVNVISAFVFNTIFVAYFGAADAGWFFFLFNNLFFIQLFLGLGLESGISYYNARKEIDKRSLTRIALLWSFAATALLAPVLYHPAFFSILQLHAGKVLVMVYIFGALLTTFLAAIFYTSHENRAPNILFAAANLLLTVTLLEKKWSGVSISIATFTEFYLIVYSILGPVMLLMLLARRPGTLSPVKSTRGKMPGLIKYSLYSFLLAGLFTLLKRCDYWLVERFCPPEDMGNYYQSTKIIQLVLLVPSLASFSLYPLLVESIKDRSDAEKKVTRLVAVYLSIAILLSLPLVAAGNWIFPFLYGGTFTKLYPTTLFLIPGLIMFAGTYPLTVYFSGRNENMTNIRGLATAIIILLSIDLLLLPRYSIYGAGIGSTIANGFYFVFLLYHFKRTSDVSFKELSREVSIKQELITIFQTANNWIK